MTARLAGSDGDGERERGPLEDLDEQIHDQVQRLTDDYLEQQQRRLRPMSWLFRSGRTGGD